MGWIGTVITFNILAHIFLVRMFAYVRHRKGNVKKNLFVEWILVVPPLSIIAALFLIIVGSFIDDEHTDSIDNQNDKNS